MYHHMMNLMINYAREVDLCKYIPDEGIFKTTTQFTFIIMTISFIQIIIMKKMTPQLLCTY